MQYVMYPPILFYYTFSQQTTYMYVNILKRNEIPIFSLSIATNIQHFWVCICCLCTLTLPWLDGTEMPYSYTPWILNICTKYMANDLHVSPQSLYHVLSYLILYNPRQQHAYHSYHRNHKIQSFMKIVHTIKPLLGLWESQLRSQFTRTEVLKFNTDGQNP